MISGVNVDSHDLNEGDSQNWIFHVAILVPTMTKIKEERRSNGFNLKIASKREEGEEQKD